jgi:hypothetical protein
MQRAEKGNGSDYSLQESWGLRYIEHQNSGEWRVAIYITISRQFGLKSPKLFSLERLRKNKSDASQASQRG